MDSLTHIALGACMGEAFAGKTVGRKAMLWGALAQSIPDIDFLAATWMDTTSNLLAHRGFTHSVLFTALIVPGFALLAERLHRPHNISLGRWMFFFAAAILMHIFVDAFNNYGVGWWEPFNHDRISFNCIYVVDPFFSIVPGIALLALLLLRPGNRSRAGWWKLGLLVPALYLGYCVYNKSLVNRSLTKFLKAEQLTNARYFSTPAPLQNWLWYVVASTDSGYLVGYHSVFDSKPNYSFTFVPINDSLLDPFAGHADLQQLQRFSQHFYTVEKWGDTTVFNDLRFGQVIGWKDSSEKFAFHYFLKDSADNRLVVQRGRFAKWDKAALLSLWKRIKGN